MLRAVKEFIENNIDYIEVEDWRSIFNQWYIFADDYWPDDNEEFQDFYQTLIQCGITPDENIRRDVLQDKIIRVIIEFYVDNPDAYSIDNAYIVGSLISHLGYNLAELKRIIDDSAAEIGYVPTNNGGFRKLKGH